ncbi:hypothetical protein CSUB01_01307 [Colletotrichum sublineola]|uniref:Uncharacterized protein n=1 Tax=Colletotrichum sublineola TaxID=1173701 RepID=A0A066X983_COLSU|nr:hypothetical protein CSUB01_01307 [Colletotrichum sublineola]
MKQRTAPDWIIGHCVRSWFGSWRKTDTHLTAYQAGQGPGQIALVAPLEIEAHMFDVQVIGGAARGYW